MQQRAHAATTAAALPADPIVAFRVSLRLRSAREVGEVKLEFVPTLATASDAAGIGAKECRGRP